MNKKYNIVYADPPWSYNSRRSNYIANGSGETLRHYDTLTLDELKEMPINEITDKNAMLFMWATFPQLQEALDLIKAWGFIYKTVAFSWVKTTKDGTKPAFGVGYYTRNNVEICLLGVKGKPFKEVGNMSSVVISPREEHSKKPDIVREKIVELCGNLPRIELFARKETEGWDVFGNEVENSNNELNFLL